MTPSKFSDENDRLDNNHASYLAEGKWGFIFIQFPLISKNTPDVVR